MSFVERDENMEGLKLRREPNPTELFNERMEIMKRTTFAIALGDKQKEVISLCDN